MFPQASVILFTGWGVCLPGGVCGRHPLPSACGDTHPPAQCMLGYTPPHPRRPLQRTVRILLECFLVTEIRFISCEYVNLRVYKLCPWFSCKGYYIVCCSPSVSSDQVLTDESTVQRNPKIHILVIQKYYCFEETKAIFI